MGDGFSLVDSKEKGTPASSVTTDVEDEGLAARLVQTCSSLLAFAVRQLQSPLTNTHKQSLLRVTQLLTIWSDDHAVEDGDLDRILQRSAHLMTVVISALKALLSTLFLDLLRGQDCKGHRQAVLQLLEQSSFVEVDSSDTESEDELDNKEKLQEAEFTKPRPIDEILKDIRKGIQRLNDLSASIVSPVLDTVHDHAEKPATETEQVAPHQFFSSCIRERFQTASKDLVDRLGMMNLERYQRLSKLRVKNGDAIAINVSDEASKQSGSSFKDSAIGSSLQPSSYRQPLDPVSSYAPSIATTAISSRLSSLLEGGRSKYPRLPEEAKGGILFDCSACGRYIRALKKHEYRKHVIQDLMPYVCIFGKCLTRNIAFVDKRRWMDHILLEHREAGFLRTKICPVCNEKKAEGEKNGLLASIAKHLEEVSLLALPPDVDEEESGSETSSLSEDNGGQKPKAESSPKNSGKSPATPKQESEKESGKQHSPEKFQNPKTTDPLPSTVPGNLFDVLSGFQSDVRYDAGFAGFAASQPLIDSKNLSQHEQDWYGQGALDMPQTELSTKNYVSDLYTQIEPQPRLRSEQLSSSLYGYQPEQDFVRLSTLSSSVDPIPIYDATPISSMSMPTFTSLESYSRQPASPASDHGRPSKPSQPPKFPLTRDQSPKMRTASPPPSRQSSKRSNIMKLLCPHCNDNPNGYRGEHELQRHISRAHAHTRIVWICVDSSADGKFLGNCKACRMQKQYGAYYNAAAHLRRAHFNPRKRERRVKREENEKRGGKVRTPWPPMEHLKNKWMREITVEVQDNHERVVDTGEGLS